MQTDASKRGVDRHNYVFRVDAPITARPVISCGEIFSQGFDGSTVFEAPVYCDESLAASARLKCSGSKLRPAMSNPPTLNLGLVINEEHAQIVEAMRARDNHPAFTALLMALREHAVRSRRVAATRHTVLCERIEHGLQPFRGRRRFAALIHKPCLHTQRRRAVDIRMRRIPNHQCLFSTRADHRQSGIE